MAELFSKSIGAFVLHILCKNEIYRITCPRESQKSLRTGKDFIFQIESNNNKYNIVVFATDILLASEYTKEILQVAYLRAVKKAISVNEECIGLANGNIEEYVIDKYLDKPDTIIRNDIEDYIQKRYEIHFEKPFSIIEILITIETKVERIVKNLHYLHKHELISFNWSSELWNDRSTLEEWFPEEFNITNANLQNLRSNYKRNNTNIGYEVFQSENIEYDFFISHASEDKEKVVEPLAVILNNKGYYVWYDRWTLKLGDSLRQKIDEGLAQSKYGIVILSPNFFQKNWTKIELSGLVQKEIGGNKVILPVWHNVNHAEVLRYSLTLADRVAGSTKDGLDKLANTIIESTSPLIQPKNKITNTQILNLPAQLNIIYEEIQLYKELHEYRLIFHIKLLKKPDQGRLRLRFYWPLDIPIINMKNLIKGDRRYENEIEFQEFILNWENRIFPGETMQILGLQSRNILEYKFNDTVWKALQKKPRDLKYELYFEDHDPLVGSMSFNNLNNF